MRVVEVVELVRTQCGRQRRLQRWEWCRRWRLPTPRDVRFEQVQFIVCQLHLPKADQQQMKLDQNLGLGFLN